MRGTLADGRTTERWLRWTACFREIDGRWQVTHEHVSVPIDMASGKACSALHLDPRVRA
jgi:ketosteroid isomerase-like protein